jgi:hypothetical protein
MSGMFPDNQTIEIFGERVQWPGVDANGKFTNGSFSDPLIKPSFIPAETINLILNNLEELIKKCNENPDSAAVLQLANLLTNQPLANKIIQRDALGRAKVAAPEAGDDIARKNEVDAHANGTVAIHGATNLATANRIIIRDAGGGAQVASPAFDDDSLLIAPTQWVRANFNTRTVGDLVPFTYMPSVADMIRMRVLPLNGQVLPILQYEDLFEVEWSAAIQTSGDWWYRCTSSGTRDPEGDYFRVLDHRGVGIRAAGQSSKYTMANDTPYDGGSIGTYLADAIRNIYGEFGYDSPPIAMLAAFGGGVFASSFYPIVANAVTTGTPSAGNGIVTFDVSRVYGAGHIADEVRTATISSYLCVKY